jgi:hypothetical protein
MFDAYTIRKVLPRLVFAVIALQFSWAFCYWLITFVNELGRGIAAVFYAIFNGGTPIELTTLIKGGTSGGVILLFSGIALLTVGLVAIFTSIALAIPVLISVFVAVVVLTMRQIVILLCVILVPLAIVAWILPGTDRYFKLWWTTFSKMLMMFPMIIALIVMGRVFGLLAEGGINSAGDPGSLSIFILVLVGYFGPYFFLPQTFKWGGQLMGAAGAAGMKYGKQASQKPSAFFKKRQEGLSAERRRKSQERYSQSEGFNYKRPWRRPLDLVRSGQVDPTLWGRRKQQAMTGYAAAGAESEAKDVKDADARANLLFTQVDDHDKLARAMADGDADYEYDIRDKDGNIQKHKLGKQSAAERQAGLNAVARFGGDSNFLALDRIVTQLRSSNSGEDRALAKKFLDANVGSLQPKMKHFYYGTERDSSVDSMIGAMSESSFVGMEGVEMQAVMESLTRRASGGDATAVAGLSRVMTFYQSAIDNENIRPNINSGVNRAMESFVGGRNLQEINGKRGDSRLNPIERDVAENPALTGQVRALSGRIDTYGNISSTPTTPSGGSETSDTSPRGIVIPPTYRPRSSREDESGPETGTSDSEGTLIVPREPPPSGGSIPPEDFGSEGRFPPPNIPPGPGNV